MPVAINAPRSSSGSDKLRFRSRSLAGHGTWQGHTYTAKKVTTLRKA